LFELPSSFLARSAGVADMFMRIFPFLVLSLLLLTATCGKVEQVNITISGGATGTDLDFTVAGAQRFMEQNPGMRVNVAPTPASGAGRQVFYELLSERKSSEVDVYQIDVIWAGIFADHAVDLHDYVPPTSVDKHLETILESNTVEGKLVAMPWYTELPFLYYRADLLEKYGFNEPPATWDTLEVMAAKIAEGERQAGNYSFWGYVWQGRAYEGLTCNALEWQGSHGGGNFVSDEAIPRLTNLETISAFKRVASWIGRITPLEVTTMEEEESRLFFQKGDAAFLRNWPSVYAILKQDEVLVDKFGFAPLPAGPGGRAATLGGWNLMVSAYSDHPKEAAALVEFLTSEAEQKRRVILGAYMPTVKSLYEDPDVQSAIPFMREFEEIRQDQVVRPSAQTGSEYDEVSKTYFNAVFDILHGADVADRLALAEGILEEILRGR
jgi:trehalose/maltose transport system substrate-binding protein